MENDLFDEEYGYFDTNDQFYSKEPDQSPYSLPTQRVNTLSIARGRGTKIRGTGRGPVTKLQKTTDFQSAQKSSSGRGKGQNFSADEIKTFLFGLYEGKDNNSIAEDYFYTYVNSPRTKPSLKVKIQALRMEMAHKLSITTNKTEFDKTLLNCFEFTKPLFITRTATDEKEKESQLSYFLVYKKSNYKDIKVGHNNNQLRFQLIKEKTLPDEKYWVDADVESKNNFLFTFEACFFIHISCIKSHNNRLMQVTDLNKYLKIIGLKELSWS